MSTCEGMICAGTPVPQATQLKRMSLPARITGDKGEQKAAADAANQHITWCACTSALRL